MDSLENKKMAKVIALYNHKGGVSKTTTTFNLGWALADMGYKVGMIDLDPQVNLTALVLGLNDIDDFSTFYNTKGNENIYEILYPILSGEDTKIKAVKPCDTLHENLYLVAGHIEMSDIDIELTLGLVSTKYQSYSRQFVGALNAIIRETARMYDWDIVLLDMSPSSGGMNRILLMGSDYFMIPTSPDFFCYQAIQSLSKMIPKWHDDTWDFRKPDVPNSLPVSPPKFLGIVSQKYNVYRGKMAKSYEEWMNKIQSASYAQLGQSLNKYQMVISESDFKKYVRKESPYNLISVPDFNSLIAISQEFATPVFKLTKEQINRSGNVETIMMNNVEEFKQLFSSFAESICGLIGMQPKLSDFNQKLKQGLEFNPKK